jgi:hypothetical protein
MMIRISKYSLPSVWIESDSEIIRLSLDDLIASGKLVFVTKTGNTYEVDSISFWCDDIAGIPNIITIYGGNYPQMGGESGESLDLLTTNFAEAERRSDHNIPPYYDLQEEA